MTTGLIPVTLSIPPWFHDHRFAGRTVLAAVEAMRLLAEEVRAMHPGIAPLVMADGRFNRFLEIAPDAAEVEILLDLKETAGGNIRAGLFARQKLKAMTRIINCCEITFLTRPANDAPAVTAPEMPTDPYQLEIPADRLYRELVPFGPAYRSLKGQLLLTEEEARGQVQAPDLPGPTRDDNPAGNPFPLDGAMHAACAHGQRRVDYIPFPVGFAMRTIHLPTRAGECYGTRVRLQSRHDEELVYDIWLFDKSGTIREEVKGLRMRDVSGGRIKPPAWIRSRW